MHVLFEMTLCVMPGGFKICNRKNRQAYFARGVQKRMQILEFSKINEIHCIYECFLNITLFHWRGSKTQNWRSRLRCRAHFFVVAALRGNAISVFVNTSAARACCAGVFVRSALMVRVAFDDTSNVIFVVLALMPLKCKRRAYSHTRL